MLDTLENVKARLGITDPTYDTFLTQQIQLISDTIEAYLRRKLLSASYIQTFYRGDYIPSKVLQTYHYPVTAVEEILQDGEELDTDYFRIHKPTGRITTSQNYFFYSEETSIEYTAGYETCPTPILDVLDSLVQERYNKKASGVNLNFGSDVQRISIPGAISIDFDYTLSNNDRKSSFGSILGSNLNVLDYYRSERTIIGSSQLEYVEEETP